MTTAAPPAQHSLVNLESEDQFNTFIQNNTAVVVHFWTSWCTPTCPKMDQFCMQLKTRIGPSVQFGRLEADADHLSRVTEEKGVSAVPTFLLYHRGKLTAKVEGADPVGLARAVEELKKLADSGILAMESTGTGAGADGQQTTGTEDLNARLKRLINAAPNVVFMKGTPAVPRCGFSHQLVQILKKHDVKFEHFDILTDEAVRQGLKEYSDWPTYPQLYHNGELIGGLDIVKDLEAEGELAKVLELDKEWSALENRLRTLINMAPIMLFMKGTPSAPRCGFSQRAVQLLQKKGAQFGYFDILTDESVRQGLKKFSDWQTYPQVYVNGELIGGLDILNELEEEGQLSEALGLE